MFRKLSVCFLLAAFCLLAADSPSLNWPQFRGPGGSGIGDDRAELPSEFGPNKNVIWKTALPSGHGSPCIWGDRIFVTSYDAGKKLLEVIAIDRKDGKIVWRRSVDAPQIEKVHAENNPASSTPVTDGDRVYVYFGSFGLIAYDFAGKVAWQHPMPIYGGPYGSGTSPVLAGDVVLLSLDHLPDPALVALNKKDGTLAWKADLAKVRMASSASHSTPLIWKNQVVLNRPTRVSGHSLKDGAELWKVATTSVGETSLIADGDTIYAALFNLGADPAGKVEKTPWSVALAKYDKNKDGKLSLDEVPDDDLYFLQRVGVPLSVPGAHFTIKLFFKGLDRNQDGFIDEAEYDAAFSGFGVVGENNGLMAIRPEGTGDLSGQAIVWKERRSVPEIPSPLAYRGQVYMVASGGILTAVDAKTGTLLYRSRVKAPGTYYASPVAAGGKVLVTSSEGVITVLSAGPDFKILSSNEFGERIFGTPALVDSRIYIRSSSALWAFGEK
jgi:outer membrane protein assembly factor BamB